MICAPPENGSSNELADWLELQVFGSTTHSAPLNDINESLEIAEDFEPKEIDAENLNEERRLQMAVAAIDERMKALGNTYPFELDPEGQVLTQKGKLTPGGFSYLFCLAVSSAAKNGFLGGKGPWAPDLKEGYKLFQVCATVCAAGHMGGPSFSVGWPRPSSSSFLTKLKTIYDLFGDGKVHKKLPPGAPKKVKDDEIDVIAWKNTHGMKPPVGYFLGQAAAGLNWGDKTLKGAVGKYHDTWFEKSPAAAPATEIGIIIPFMLPSDADIREDARHDHENQEAIETKLRRATHEFGTLLYRHRVARFTDEAGDLAKKGVKPIERLEDFGKIEKYVTVYQTKLVAAMTKK